MVHRQDKAIGAGQHRKGTGLHQGGQVWMAAPQPAGMGPVGWQDDSDGVNQKTRGAAAGQAGFGVVMARDFKVVEVAIWRKAIPAICALAPYMVSGIAYDFGRRMVSLEIGMAQ